MVLVVVLEPDDTNCNLHSGFVVCLLGPISDDCSNASLRVPVNNYRSLVIIPEKLISS